jgi:hypothetical protein
MMTSSVFIDALNITADRLFTPKLVAEVGAVLGHAAATGEKAGALDKIRHALIAGDVAWYSWVRPDQAGVHPINRSSLGVIGSDAQELGAEILSDGWSWHKCAHSTAFQAPPGDWIEEAKAFNDHLVSLSEGVIPELRSLQVLSVGCSHTNTFLRQVAAGVRCVVPALMPNASGMLDKDQLAINRHEFQKAIDGGLQFLVLHWQCAYAWPELANFIQDALNVEAKLFGELAFQHDLHL